MQIGLLDVFADLQLNFFAMDPGLDGFESAELRRDLDPVPGARCPCAWRERVPLPAAPLALVKFTARSSSAAGVELLCAGPRREHGHGDPACECWALRGVWVG